MRYFLILVLLLAGEAEARYCNNPNCAMCNRIFGPMRPVQRSTAVQRPDLTLVSTPPELVEAIFDVVGIRKGDVFCDPGCGDGRFLKAAMRRGAAAAIGLELNPATAMLARQNLPVGAAVIESDASKLNLAPFDVTIMYLFPPSMPDVSTAKSGSVVVSINHPIPNARRVTVGGHVLYVLRVP